MGRDRWFVLFSKFTGVSIGSTHSNSDRATIPLIPMTCGSWQMQTWARTCSSPVSTHLLLPHHCKSSFKAGVESLPTKQWRSRSHVSPQRALAKRLKVLFWERAFLRAEEMLLWCNFTVSRLIHFPFISWLVNFINTYHCVVCLRCHEAILAFLSLP